MNWRHGMPPSQWQLNVLYVAARAEANRHDAYGGTTAQIAKLVNGTTLYVNFFSNSCVYDVLAALRAKGYVDNHDRRRHGGENTWQVTDRGRVLLLCILHPELGRGYHPPGAPGDSPLRDPQRWYGVR